MSTRKIDLKKVEEWLAKVRAREKEESEQIYKNWPIHEIGSSSKFLVEERLALETKHKRTNQKPWEDT